MQTNSLLFVNGAPITVLRQNDYSQIKFVMDKEQAQKYAKAVLLVINETNQEGQYNVQVNPSSMEIINSTKRFWEALRKNLFGMLEAYLKENNYQITSR